MGNPEAVTVAYVCGNTVHYSWFRSFFELREYDRVHSGRIEKGGFIATRHGSGGLVEARNKTVATFLEEDLADWLWWVDTDMGFSPDTIDRLLEAADPIERPIVGGLCFFNREDKQDGMGGWRQTVVPTIYDWCHIDDQYGWQIRWKYPINTLTKCEGTGAACILVHRSVFEKIAAKDGRVWYDRVLNTSTGVLIGEDLSFCLRAGAAKIPIHVHTGVATTHFKNQWLSEEDYWGQVALDDLAKINAKLKDDSDE